jgi:hypothetical protein
MRYIKACDLKVDDEVRKDGTWYRIQEVAVGLTRTAIRARKLYSNEEAELIEFEGHVEILISGDSKLPPPAPSAQSPIHSIEYTQCNGMVSAIIANRGKVLRYGPWRRNSGEATTALLDDIAKEWIR